MPRIFDAVPRSRRDTDRVAGTNFKTGVVQGHHADATRDVIKLFRLQVLVQYGFSAHRDGRFRQALVVVALYRWMHEFTNFRAIFCDVRSDGGVGLAHGGYSTTKLKYVWGKGSLL